MHSFQSVDDLYFVTLNQLMNQAPIVNTRLGRARELFAVAVALTDPLQNFVMHPSRKLSPVYANAELLWYLSGTERSEMIQHYAPSYAQYVEDDGNDWGAYGYRLAKNLLTDECRCSELQIITRMLAEDPNSRQAVAMIWRPTDVYHAYKKTRKSIPCTICWQFLIRDGRLHMIATMRSNDAWLGLPYDIYAFTSIQQLVAGELGIDAGVYAHQVGSMHIYEKDWPKAEMLLKRGPNKALKIDLLSEHKGYYMLRHNYTRPDFTGLADALAAEIISRTGGDPSKVADCPSPLLHDAAAICIASNLDRDPMLHSPLLRKAYDDYRGRRRQSRKVDVVPDSGSKD